jgi:hypothetical protein
MAQQLPKRRSPVMGCWNSSGSIRIAYAHCLSLSRSGVPCRMPPLEVRSQGGIVFGGAAPFALPGAKPETRACGRPLAPPCTNYALYQPPGAWSWGSRTSRIPRAQRVRGGGGGGSGPVRRRCTRRSALGAKNENPRRVAGSGSRSALRLALRLAACGLWPTGDPQRG